jgi:hypothetical protein
MGFLDSAAITIDATLTRLGRKRLVNGNFKIDRFALSDEGVDYTLYDINHPSGSDSYGTVIENMNVLEASPVRSGFMSYLVDNSLANRTFGLEVDYPPREDASIDSSTGRFASDPVPLEAGVTLNFKPNRKVGLNELYYFTIHNTRVIKFIDGDGSVKDGVNIQGPTAEAQVKTQVFDTTERDAEKNIMPYATTKVIVRGADSGMSAILTVTVHRTPGGTVDAAAPPKYLTDEELSQEE